MTNEIKQRLPMWVTLSRVLLAPVLMALVLLPSPWSTWGAAVVFTIGSITDWLDGYLARKFNARTNMGKFMDPIADKVLVLAALLILVENAQIGPLMAFILISRDILIGGIRSVAATDGVVIDAKSTGKIKTALQMIAIPCLFIQELPYLNFSIAPIGYWGLWVSVLLSLKSGWDYGANYFKGRQQ